MIVHSICTLGEKIHEGGRIKIRPSKLTRVLTYLFWRTRLLTYELLNCRLHPPPPPPNTATMITLSRSRDMFSLKTWTVSLAITRTKTRNSTRGILQLRLQFNYPDEFGTQKKVSSEAVPLTNTQKVRKSAVFKRYTTLSQMNVARRWIRDTLCD